MNKRRLSLVACVLLGDPLGEGATWISRSMFHVLAFRRTTQRSKPSPSPRSSLLRRRLLRQRSDVETDGINMETTLDLAIARMWRLRVMPFLNPPLMFRRRIIRFDSTSSLIKYVKWVAVYPRCGRCKNTSPVDRERRHHRYFGMAKRGGEGNETRLTSDYAVTPAGDGLDSVRPAWGVGEGGSVRPEIPKWKHKAVIIPGFATDARAFEQMCHRLERRGIASVVVPIRWYHWLPTLGGRSVRPILDRIHETVIRCVAAESHKQMPYAFNEPGLQSMVAPYTVQDFLSEMVDPKNGAHHMGPLDLPRVPQLPSVDDRVVLIAHSAGGWISRIYLSEARYDGRMYNGSLLVNGLVTLGTPHVRLEDDQGRPRELPFSTNFKFVEDFCSGEKGGRWQKTTPTACIGGAVLRGRSILGGFLKDLVYQSYELCCGDGTGIGDGITPLESAFDMPGAKRFIQLKGVYHAAGLGGAWYGSDNVIDSWLEPSFETIFGSPSTEEESSTATTQTPGIVPWDPLSITLGPTPVTSDGRR